MKDVGVNREGCGLLDADMKERSRNPLVCAITASVRVRVSCLLKNRMACCESSLSGWKLKEFKVSHFAAAKISQKHRRILILSFFYLFFFKRCLNTDSASDDAGMMECRADAKGEQIK